MRPERTESPENWKAYWRSRDHRDEVLGSDDGLHDAYKWIHSRSIRIYCMPAVGVKALINVSRGIQEAYRGAGLDLRLSYADRYDDVERLDLEMQWFTGENGGLYCREFAHVLSSEYAHLNHAKVLITTRPLFPRLLSASTDYARGYSVISLTNGKDPYFLERIAKHEAYHLLGYPYEHDIETVEGYPQVSCNMQTGAPTIDTCTKCLDALVSFWKGIEERTGERFFKQSNK